jgi:hypothetical protein
MSNIFPDLRQAVHNSPSGIARLVDPDTNEQFVVMSAESYQKRIKHVFEADGTPAAETVDAVMRGDDQHDPFLERYQEEHAGQ